MVMWPPYPLRLFITCPHNLGTSALVHHVFCSYSGASLISMTRRRLNFLVIWFSWSVPSLSISSPPMPPHSLPLDFSVTPLRPPRQSASDSHLNKRFHLPIPHLSLSHSSLTSLPSSLPPPVNPPRSFHVAAGERCPSPSCRLQVSHDHIDLTPRPRFDHSLPETQLTRFPPHRNHFPPTLDIWCLDSALDVQVYNGLWVYDKLFSEVRLVQCRIKARPKGWRVFSMVDINGNTRAHIAVRAPWCARGTLAEWWSDNIGRMLGI